MGYLIVIILSVLAAVFGVALLRASPLSVDLALGLLLFAILVAVWRIGDLLERPKS